MDDKNTLLKSCRYYKGEEDSPFAQAVPSYIWKTECNWVARQLGDDKDKIVSDKSANIIIPMACSILKKKTVCQ